MIGAYFQRRTKKYDHLAASQNVHKVGLKIPRGKTRAGSIPASGTNLKTAQQLAVRFFFT